MKYLFLFLAIVSAIACQKSQPPKVNAASALAPAMPKPVSPFVGKWQWTKNTDLNTFDLTIVQQGDTLRGSYCMVVRGGAKTDCQNPEPSPVECSFALPVPSGNVFETEFRNAFSGTSGKVKMQLEGATLSWWITQECPGEFYAPRDANLKKI